MGGIAYDGCLTRGHDKYGPTKVQATQTKVYVQGKAVVVNGDPIIPHPHGGSVIASSKVYINGVMVAKIGDKITCGDTIAQGNSKVDIK